MLYIKRIHDFGFEVDFFALTYTLKQTCYKNVILLVSLKKTEIHTMKM